MKNTKRYINGLQSFDCRTQVYRIDPCIVLESAGHEMAGIAASVSKSLEIINVAGPGRAFPGQNTSFRPDEAHGTIKPHGGTFLILNVDPFRVETSSPHRGPF